MSCAKVIDVQTVHCICIDNINTIERKQIVCTRPTDRPTESDDFPEQNAERPHIGLGRVFGQHERLWRHPANGQTPLFRAPQLGPFTSDNTTYVATA